MYCAVTLGPTRVHTSLCIQIFSFLLQNDTEVYAYAVPSSNTRIRGQLSTQSTSLHPGFRCQSFLLYFPTHSNFPKSLSLCTCICICLIGTFSPRHRKLRPPCSPQRALLYFALHWCSSSRTRSACRSKVQSRRATLCM